MTWRRQAIIWNNDGLGYRRIYAPLGLNQLIRENYVNAVVADALATQVGEAIVSIIRIKQVIAPVCACCVCVRAVSVWSCMSPGLKFGKECVSLSNDTVT